MALDRASQAGLAGQAACSRVAAVSASGVPKSMLLCDRDGDTSPWRCASCVFWLLYRDNTHAKSMHGELGASTAWRQVVGDQGVPRRIFWSKQAS